MDRNEFKDRLAISMMPLFTQIMFKVQASTLQMAMSSAPSEATAQVPDPQFVSARVYAYCEQCAMVRDEYAKILKQQKGQGAARFGKKEPKMAFTKAAGNGGSKDGEGGMER